MPVDKSIRYVREQRIAPLLNDLIMHLLATKPEDPLPALIRFLEKRIGVAPTIPSAPRLPAAAPAAPAVDERPSAPVVPRPPDTSPRRAQPSSTVVSEEVPLATTFTDAPSILRALAENDTAMIRLLQGDAPHNAHVRMAAVVSDQFEHLLLDSSRVHHLTLLASEIPPALDSDSTRAFLAERASALIQELTDNHAAFVTRSDFETPVTSPLANEISSLLRVAQSNARILSQHTQQQSAEKGGAEEHAGTVFAPDANTHAADAAPTPRLVPILTPGTPTSLVGQFGHLINQLITNEEAFKAQLGDADPESRSLNEALSMSAALSESGAAADRLRRALGVAENTSAALRFQQTLADLLGSDTAVVAALGAAAAPDVLAASAAMQAAGNIAALNCKMLTRSLQESRFHALAVLDELAANAEEFTALLLSPANGVEEDVAFRIAALNRELMDLCNHANYSATAVSGLKRSRDRYHATQSFAVSLSNDAIPAA